MEADLNLLDGYESLRRAEEYLFETTYRTIPDTTAFWEAVDILRNAKLNVRGHISHLIGKPFTL